VLDTFQLDPPKMVTLRAKNALWKISYMKTQWEYFMHNLKQDLKIWLATMFLVWMGEKKTAHKVRYSFNFDALMSSFMIFITLVRLRFHFGNTMKPGLVQVGDPDTCAPVFFMSSSLLPPSANSLELTSCKANILHVHERGQNLPTGSRVQMHSSLLKSNPTSNFAPLGWPDCVVRLQRLPMCVSSEPETCCIKGYLQMVCSCAAAHLLGFMERL
jgi:hypothetical protein